jgi:hypothetical protein
MLPIDGAITDPHGLVFCSRPARLPCLTGLSNVQSGLRFDVHPAKCPERERRLSAQATLDECRDCGRTCSMSGSSRRHPQSRRSAAAAVNTGDFRGAMQAPRQARGRFATLVAWPRRSRHWPRRSSRRRTAITTISRWVLWGLSGPVGSGSAGRMTHVCGSPVPAGFSKTSPR